MNRLLWKILKQNLNKSRIVGFCLANCLGLTIVLVGIFLYRDLSRLLSADSGLIKPDYVFVNKPVSSLGSLLAGKPYFTEKEKADLLGQPFVVALGEFTAAKYSVTGQISVPRLDVYLSTDLFLESVPEQFVDIQSDNWHFDAKEDRVPIVIPKDYLSLYNFGFAASADLPLLSEEMIKKVRFELVLSGNGLTIRKKGRIVGFSSRLNTILVPESFIKWSNGLLSDNTDIKPSRLILQVNDPTDVRISQYMTEHQLDVDAGNLNASKAMQVVRLLFVVVAVVGITICVLAFYVLLLSFSLLIEKNKQQIDNLSLIGYSRKAVMMPYHILAVLITLISLLCAVGLALSVRMAYLDFLSTQLGL